MSRLTGIIKSFQDRGFGFIRFQETKQGKTYTREAYFHISNYSNQDKSLPAAGEFVTLELGPSKDPNKPEQGVAVRRVETSPATEVLGGEPVSADKAVQGE